MRLYRSCSVTRVDLLNEDLHGEGSSGMLVVTSGLAMVWKFLMRGEVCEGS